MSEKMESIDIESPVSQKSVDDTNHLEPVQEGIE